MATIILSIDPGTTKSGFVILNGSVVENKGVLVNRAMERFTAHAKVDHVVIEMLSSFGMPVGREVFETAVWIGRFVSAAGPDTTTRIFRRDVKQHLCGSARAKDPHVWQSLLDRYGPGKEKAVGNRKNPGPLYGITSHERAALAVGVCWLDGVRSDVDIEATQPEMEEV